MAWVDVLEEPRDMNGDNITDYYYIPEIETYFGSKIEFSEIGLSGGAHLKDLENSGVHTRRLYRQPTSGSINSQRYQQ